MRRPLPQRRAAGRQRPGRVGGAETRGPWQVAPRAARGRRALSEHRSTAKRSTRASCAAAWAAEHRGEPARRADRRLRAVALPACGSCSAAGLRLPLHCGPTC